MQAASSAPVMRVPGNLLLDALSDAQYRKLEPHLEVVPLPVGRVLSGSDDRPTHVHFPTTGIVSVQMALEDGASEEVAVTGNEGLIGVSAFLEHGRGGAPPRRSVVQHAGHALRLPGRFVAEQFDRDGEFQRVLLRYTQALITQVAQTVVCNRHHRIAQQLCRWLLLRLDRLPVGEINATQERIAALLGVRHEGITAAVADLLRVPTHDGHGSEPMADTIPTAWRTAFRWHGGQSGGRPGTVSAMISERCPPSPGRVR